MPAVAVGAKGMYHSEYGDIPCWVVEYEEGRPQGDYLVAGFWNSKAKDAGKGDVFSLHSVVGSEQGAFTPHG